MYEYFFEYIDGIDNGIERYPKDVKPLYKSNGTNLAAWVSNLNQTWWNEDPFDDIE